MIHMEDQNLEGRVKQAEYVLLPFIKKVFPSGFEEVKGVLNDPLTALCPF